MYQAPRHSLPRGVPKESANKLLVLGWRQKFQARARVQLAIEETLDSGLPRAFDKPLFASKCTAVFEHVYESYQGDGQSVYTGVTV